MADEGYERALRAQRFREFWRAAGPLAVGLVAALAISAANHCFGPWETLPPETVAQIIPVLIIAVAIEGGGRLLPAIPRKLQFGWRASYWAIQGAYAILLLSGEMLAIVQPDEWCSKLVDGAQIAAMTAGLFTVVFGIGLGAIGAVLPIQVRELDRSDEFLYFEIGVSNEYRARKIEPLLNLVVPAGLGILEVNRDFSEIHGNSILETTEAIDGTSITEWDFLSREFGLTAGDNRIGRFRINRPVSFDQVIPIVVRLDHQDLYRNRSEIQHILKL